ADDIDLVTGDIRDVETCRRVCEGKALVLHHAALGSVPHSMADPATAFAVNVGGTANVFAAAHGAGVKRVVYASSSAVYGDGEGLPKKEGEEGKPLSPYALSKVMNEQLGDVFARCYGMDLVGLRYFNVFGPRQDPAGPYAAVIPRFFAACRAGEPPTIFGDGQQGRDFVYVADVVRANLLAATVPLQGAHAVNIGAGVVTTVLELAETIIQTTSAKVKPKLTDPRPGDVLMSQADTTAARALLGFSAERAVTDGLASMGDRS
ncbi:MAG: NAD-dependent epimerase/dehydratase family protein, partial [Deltaproteobacteria bacterium]|nr:NAD-dependent epimerase/dehydratase family protein [Deltaproteobacteria bacterium]